MIFDSVKSAEPTVIDLRSPDISPPPSGLELPHPAVISASTAATTARIGLRVLDIPNVLSAHWLPRTLSRCAPERLSLGQPDRRCGFFRCWKGQRWNHDQRSG